MPPERTVRGFGLLDQLKDRKQGVGTLLAYVENEDEPRRVAVPDVRNRHQRVMRVLDALRWTKVEFLDRKGELVYVHHRGPDDEKAAGELEDLTGGPTTARAAEISSIMGATAHWLLKAQDVALQRHTAAMAATQEAQQKIVESTIKRFEVMDKQNAELFRLNHMLSGELLGQQLKSFRKAAQAATEGEAGESPMSDKLVEALLPAFVEKMMESPADSPRPNGKSKPNGVKE